MAEQFAERLLAELDRLTECRVDGRNIDEWRFPPETQARLRRNDRVFREVRGLVATAPERFAATAALLADDCSRDWLAALYCFRALGPDHVRLASNRPGYWAHYDEASRWRIGPSGRGTPPFEMAVWRCPFGGATIDVECYLGNVVFTFLAGQYFFERAGLSVKPEAGDVAIDAGGCFGDTALAFAEAVGPQGKVFSFEPIAESREVLVSNLARNPRLAGRVELANEALWNRSGDQLMFRESGPSSAVRKGGTAGVMSKTIDDFVAEHSLRRLDFVKMDIEGAEREALAGAADSIRRFRPKLAISAYHWIDDLLVLPALVREIEPSYEMFLDHYTVHGEETVLYAVAR